MQLKTRTGRARWPSRPASTWYGVPASVILVLALLGALGLCVTGMVAAMAFLGSNPIGQLVIRVLLSAVRLPSRVIHHRHRNVRGWAGSMIRPRF
jgi:hypothetical protein